jgi:hypothetical protein
MWNSPAEEAVLRGGLFCCQNLENDWFQGNSAKKTSKPFSRVAGSWCAVSLRSDSPEAERIIRQFLLRDDDGIANASYGRPCGVLWGACDDDEIRARWPPKSKTMNKKWTETGHLPGAVSTAISTAVGTMQH